MNPVAVLLDTSVLHQLVADTGGQRVGAALADLHVTGARIRLPEPAFLELLEQMDRGKPISWAEWEAARARIDAIIDNRRPVVVDLARRDPFALSVGERGLPWSLRTRLERTASARDIWRALVTANSRSQFNELAAGSVTADAPETDALAVAGRWKTKRLGIIAEEARDLRDLGVTKGLPVEEMVDEVRSTMAEESFAPATIGATVRAMRSTRPLERNAFFDALVCSYADLQRTIVLTGDKKMAAGAEHQRVVYWARGADPESLIRAAAVALVEARA